MIDVTDIQTLIGFGIGAFGIGYTSGFLLLAFKKAAGLIK